jgi:hypothetical protein
MLRRTALSRLRLALVSALVLSSLSVLVAPSGAAQRTVRPLGLAPVALPTGATGAGQVAGDQQVDFEVVLRPRDPAAIASLLAGQYRPGSPDFEQWLSPGAFAQRFGPSPATVAATLGWLRGLGLEATAGQGFSVGASGPASRIDAGLGVSLQRYRLASGQAAFSARGTPKVPAALGPEVSSIVGLDDLPVAVPQSDATPAPAALGSRAAPAADPLGTCAGANSTAGGAAYTTASIGAAYGVTTMQADGLTGAGKTIALLELAPSSSGDVSAFDTCFGISDRLSVVPVDGGGTPDAGGTAEADLDIEQVATQAPEASILSYEGPNTDQGSYDTAKRIVTDDTAKFVSTSWGLCEPLNPPSGSGSIASFDVLLQQAAAQGQAVFAAAGDHGSEDCDGVNGSTAVAVDYPASNPWVTGVGGTTRSLNGTETVWNACQGAVAGSDCGREGAGGGGFSSVEARPAWQSGLPAPAGASCGGNGSNCRMVPDISLNAGVPEAFVADGSWALFVGTSLGAPFAAALWADRSAGCTTTASGAAAPVLYQLAATGAYAGGINDVTSGDNDFTGTNGGRYGAGPGYDLASGLGSIYGPGVACTELLSASPSQGPAGTVVTLHGLGLEDASFAVGGAAVAPLSVTPTTAEIPMPAGSGTVAISAAGPVADGTAGPVAFTYGPPAGVFTRVAGNTAIETAIATSQLDFPAAGSAHAVVLARSDFFSDALAGGPLAAAVDGPLLITEGAAESSSLDPEVQGEIERVLTPGGTVYILGGTFALSGSIDTTLQGLGYKTQRLAGNDEYATAVLIAQQLGNPATVFEATGLDFPDALSAVPAAVAVHGAILLTDGSTQDPETAAYLAAHPIDTRYAIGGQFAAAGADPGATAVLGETQYDTSAAVAFKFFGSPSAVGAATGANFPDALAAGPGLGRAGAPMFLVPPLGPLPGSVVFYLSVVGGGVRSGALFGGVFAVSDQVMAELDGAV